MADRCIAWERPYASTGQGQPYRAGRVDEYEYADSGAGATGHPMRDHSGGLAYDPEKNTPTGFDNAYTAEVSERFIGAAAVRHGHSVTHEQMWYRTLWSEGHPPIGGDRGARLVDDSTYCPPSIATDRSCRRALDRDLAANPPRITLARLLDVDIDMEAAVQAAMSRDDVKEAQAAPWLYETTRSSPPRQRWYDEIAPTGPWECVEYEDG